MGTQAEESAQSDASLATPVEGEPKWREIPLEDLQAEEAVRSSSRPTPSCAREA